MNQKHIVPPSMVYKLRRTMNSRHWPDHKSLVSRYILATALALATLTASGGSYLWTGTTSGAWDADLLANWNGSTPVFDNQADINFYASGAANFNPTFLGNSDRTNRSLTFNANVLSPVSLQLDDNAGTGRILRFEANAGNASISIDAAAAADILIGSSSAVFPWQLISTLPMRPAQSFPSIGPLRARVRLTS